MLMPYRKGRGSSLVLGNDVFQVCDIDEGETLCGRHIRIGYFRETAW